jgi:alanine dehydrogenase
MHKRVKVDVVKTQLSRQAIRPNEIPCNTEFFLLLDGLVKVYTNNLQIGVCVCNRFGPERPLRLEIEGFKPNAIKGHWGRSSHNHRDVKYLSSTVVGNMIVNYSTRRSEMIVGLPREQKEGESRVAIIPSVVHGLTRDGHRVLVESGAGVDAGYRDVDYEAMGATIVAEHATVFADSDMVVKVKEPLAAEYPLLKDGLVLFCYLHLAAELELTSVLLDRKIAAVGYETVEPHDGELPLLRPMSEIAGRAVLYIAGSHCSAVGGGAGILLAGIPGVQTPKAVVIGGGVVGTNAATALSHHVDVTVIDVNIGRLREIEFMSQGRIHTMFSTSEVLANELASADVVVGAVLVPGAAAPKVISTHTFNSLKPGTLIIDVAIDQGGVIENMGKPTDHSTPVRDIDGVRLYAVPNIPGAYPRTASQALANVTKPYVLKLANLGLAESARIDHGVSTGINTYQGAITHPGVAQAQGVGSVSVDDLIETKLMAS